jgi:hypothetical protein
LPEDMLLLFDESHATKSFFMKTKFTVPERIFVTFLCLAMVFAITSTVLTVRQMNKESNYDSSRVHRNFTARTF